MSRLSSSAKDGDPIIIKKYANRRLYNTQTSSYITLDFLAELTREGKDFQVVDAKTGNDITRTILTQIIMDEEATGEKMLPTNFLRELISMYGNSMQSMLPDYLEASMDTFRKNQEKFHSAVRGSLTNNPFTRIAEQNLAMLQAATGAFQPRDRQKPETTAQEDGPAASAEEVELLKAQLAAMQEKIDALGSKD